MSYKALAYSVLVWHPSFCPQVFILILTLFELCNSVGDQMGKSIENGLFTSCFSRSIFLKLFNRGLCYLEPGFPTGV